MLAVTQHEITGAERKTKCRLFITRAEYTTTAFGELHPPPTKPPLIVFPRPSTTNETIINRLICSIITVLLLQRDAAYSTVQQQLCRASVALEKHDKEEEEEKPHHEPLVNHRTQSKIHIWDRSKGVELCATMERGGGGGQLYSLL